MILEWVFLALSGLSADPEPIRADVVVVVGAPGLPEYEAVFAAWSEKWRDAAAKGNANFEMLDVSEQASESDQRKRLQELLTRHAEEEQRELWIVMIGHGTFDGRIGRFNLVGPDVSSEEFSGWLAPLRRPTVIINCFSSSGTWIPSLSGDGRVVIAATRSGNEHNFSRFGEYLADAVGDETADRDKDGQTSLLEAYITACENLESYYSRDGRLATEHALIDDNGDKLGTPGDWFQGVRSVKKPENAAYPDGRRAHQFCLIPSEFERRIPLELRRERDELESKIFAWRDQKPVLADSAYLQGLEPLLVEMAELYNRIDGVVAEPSPKPSNGVADPAKSEAEARE